MPALVAGARRLREAQATMERLRTAGSWLPRGPQVRSTPRGAAFSIVSREALAAQFKVTAQFAESGSAAYANEAEPGLLTECE